MMDGIAVVSFSSTRSVARDFVKLFAISGYEKAQTPVGSRLKVWTEGIIPRYKQARIARDQA
jgi:hypothetical protein